VAKTFYSIAPRVPRGAPLRIVKREFLTLTYLDLGKEWRRGKPTLAMVSGAKKVIDKKLPFRQKVI